MNLRTFTPLALIVAVLVAAAAAALAAGASTDLAPRSPVGLRAL